MSGRERPRDVGWGPLTGRVWVRSVEEGLPSSRPRSGPDPPEYRLKGRVFGETGGFDLRDGNRTFGP